MLEGNLKSKYIKIDGIKKAYDQLMSEYISASETLRNDINKENDVFRMLDLALLCISTMTGDMVFYEHNRAKMIESICYWNSEN